MATAGNMKCETGSTIQIIKLKILIQCAIGVYVNYLLHKKPNTKESCITQEQTYKI